jgi:hypothetical protein
MKTRIALHDLPEIEQPQVTDRVCLTARQKLPELSSVVHLMDSDGSLSIRQALTYPKILNCWPSVTGIA